MGGFDWLGAPAEGATPQPADPGGTAGPDEAAREQEERRGRRFGVVPGVAGVRNVSGRGRSGRPRDPDALRNDPARMMAGARIRRDVRRRVDQALADPGISGDGKTNYSLLVEGLLVRWLDEVGYPMDEATRRTKPLGPREE
ncbi:MAG: hypothetical protein M3R38_07820 [Actinomycetota bacterium]|nr:hypothetical protein [Actinomycetota bacterium]